MATITVEPIVLKNALLSIGLDNYEKHVSSVELVPAPNAQTFHGLGDNSNVISGKTTWTANISFAQDWKTADSLSKYLFNNQGEIKHMTFSPENGVGDAFEGDILIQPGSIGGAVDSIAVTSITLPVQGAITISA